MKIDTQHTPGPWKEKRKLAIYSADDEPICAVFPAETEGQSAADARLIAAAPDLLEALRGLIDQLEAAGIHIPGEDSGQWHGAEGLSFSRAIEAIAKAEGRAE